MLTIEQILKRLEAYGIAKIAKTSGVSYQTLNNVKDKKTASLKTMQKLSTFFESIEGKSEQKVIKTS